MSDVFRTPPPNVKTELVQEFLYANFDIITSIKKLSSDRDLNLKVSTDDKNFVMKIANSSEDKSILQMQNDALRYISSQDESIEVPIPIKSKHKKDISVIECHNSRNYVRLLTYIDGDFLKDVKPNSAMLFSVGEFLGNLDKALIGFEHKSSSREFIWDADQVDVLISQLDHSRDDR